MARALDKLAYLREADLFDDLSEEELREYERTLPMIRTERDRIVVVPGDPEALFVIKEGSVRLYRIASDGREVTLGVLEAGDVFGIHPLFGASGRSSFAQCVADCVLCVLREEDLEALIRGHPEIAVRLLRIVGERLADAEDRIEDLAFRSAEQRVARSLLRILVTSGKDRLEVSHEEIARAAGVARETATKVLGGLEREGTVKTGYRRLRIVDRGRIEGLARD